MTFPKSCQLAPISTGPSPPEAPPPPPPEQAKADCWMKYEEDKKVKELAENTKVSCRNVRRRARE